MFSKSAALYDLIYGQFKDYADECRRIAELLKRIRPGAETVLDVACGTGEHARLLSRDHGLRVDGLDLEPEFVRLAQRKNPEGRFVAADMTDFDLGRHGRLSTLDFHYLIGREAGIEDATETHELGLFTRKELEARFAAAGFAAVDYDPEGLIGRGLFTARVSDRGPARQRPDAG